MIETVDFDVQKIMQQTPKNMIGTSKADYATTFIFGLDKGGKYYAVYAVFNFDNDYSGLVVIDDNDTIVNNL